MIENTYFYKREQIQIIIVIITIASKIIITVFKYTLYILIK